MYVYFLYMVIIIFTLYAISDIRQVSKNKNFFFNLSIFALFHINLDHGWRYDNSLTIIHRLPRHRNIIYYCFIVYEYWTLKSKRI